LALADARQDVLFDVLGRVFQQHRPALAVGDEEATGRRVGHPHLLGDDIALEEAALVAAIFLRPGHADPAALADLARKRGHVGVLAAWLERREGTGGNLLREEGAHLLAKLLAFLREADRIETKGCGHGGSLLET